MNEATIMTEVSSRPAEAADGAQKRAEERTTLQYWLANEDVYTSAWVRKWLERTPPQEAADTLAVIAEYANPEPHSLVRMYLHGLIAMLTTAEIISENSPAGRKSGIRAALLLSSKNDLRALAPLVRVFERHWFWKGKYQDAIEGALLHLVSQGPEGADWASHRVALRTLAEAIPHIGNGRQELSARQADLLIAVLQRLAAMADADTGAVLQTIASAEARTPQRVRVQEEARRLAGEVGRKL